MAVPKKKLSASKRHIKRQHEKITEVPVSRCNQCGRLVMRHFTCVDCLDK